VVGDLETGAWNAKKRWPTALWIVRHGESSGNVARDAAHAAGLADIAIDMRDVDVPLSELGKRQAEALGRWFADLPQHERPSVVLSSPYMRAQQTAEIVTRMTGVDDCLLKIGHDERLREKEFGILDRLTRSGIEQRHPEEAERRALVGKFYYRPPAGESWADVVLRLRSVLDSISLHYAGERVLIVAHQVVVLCLRYLLETMDEKTILAIDREGDVANCSVTEYGLEDGGGAMQLVRYNYLAPLMREGAPVTEEPDDIGAAR
jgi:2,3-bisphosphoglycerate-dependent phosphoglycerate mutase